MNTYEVTGSAALNKVNYSLSRATAEDAGGDLTLASNASAIGTAISAGDIEENMMLFGFKALLPAQVDEFSVTLSAEAFTNFGVEAGDDMKTHYKNLVSQFPSASPTALANSASGNSGEALGSHGHTQNQLHTNYYRLGLSVAMELTTL